MTAARFVLVINLADQVRDALRILLLRTHTEVVEHGFDFRQFLLESVNLVLVSSGRHRRGRSLNSSVLHRQRSGSADGALRALLQQRPVLPLHGGDLNLFLGDFFPQELNALGFLLSAEGAHFSLTDL